MKDMLGILENLPEYDLADWLYDFVLTSHIYR
jgi:hypothetical protein